MDSLDAVYDRIRAIPWFQHVGSPCEFRLPFTFRTVSSWDAAKEQYRCAEWEDTTLDARNELTSFLCAHHQNSYQLWYRAAF